MLKKLDSFIKGYKTFVSSGLFVAVAAALPALGLQELAGSIEETYIALSALYAAVVSTLRAAMPDKRGE
jgi:hypothetical protein